MLTAKSSDSREFDRILFLAILIAFVYTWAPLLLTYVRVADDLSSQFLAGLSAFGQDGRWFAYILVQLVAPRGTPGVQYATLLHLTAYTFSAWLIAKHILRDLQDLARIAAAVTIVSNPIVSALAIFDNAWPIGIGIVFATAALIEPTRGHRFIRNLVSLILLVLALASYQIAIVHFATLGLLSAACRSNWTDCIRRLLLLIGLGILAVAIYLVSIWVWFAVTDFAPRSRLASPIDTIPVVDYLHQFLGLVPLMFDRFLMRFHIFGLIMIVLAGGIALCRTSISSFSVGFRVLLTVPFILMLSLAWIPIMTTIVPMRAVTHTWLAIAAVVISTTAIRYESALLKRFVLIGVSTLCIASGVRVSEIVIDARAENHRAQATIGRIEALIEHQLHSAGIPVLIGKPCVVPIGKLPRRSVKRNRWNIYDAWTLYPDWGVWGSLKERGFEVRQWQKIADTPQFSDMPAWPAEGSVRLHGQCVFIKLGKP